MPEISLDEYDVLVRRQGGTFYLILPELSLIGSAGRLEDAWTDLAAKFDRLTGAFAEAGSADKLRRPAKYHAVSAVHAAPASIFSFIIKMLIVFVTVIGLVWAGSFVAASTIRRNIEKVTSQSEHLGGKKFWSKVETEITKTADRKISLEKQAEIQGKLQRIVAQIKPFTDELGPLFSCPAPAKGETAK